MGAVVLCMGLAALGARWAAREAFLLRPITTDENSYVFQARNFLEGRIARPAPVPPGAFYHPMIIVNEEAGWLSRYPPGHPLWLMAGVAAGMPLVMSYAGAAVGVALMARLAGRLGLPGWIPAVLLVLSPFYVFMYGTLLSHTSAFLSVASMLTAYVHWQQTGSRTAAVLAGVFWGTLFLNRSYTAFLLAVPFGADCSLRWLFSKTKRAELPGMIGFAGTAAVFAGLLKVYNKLATGSSRVSTFLLYDPSEGLGFGARHTRGAVVHHGVRRGILNTWENVQQLDGWLFGVTGGLVLVGVLMAVGWRRRWTPLLAAGPGVLWGGYVLFWFPGIEHFRPVYSFETLPFLMLGASLGIQKLLEGGAVWRKVLVAAGLAGLAWAGTGFRAEKREFFAARNRESARLAAVLREMPADSLVLLAGLGHDETHENMLNLHGLDSQPLVMRGGGLGDAFFPDLFPERTSYILRDPVKLRPEPFPAGQAYDLRLELGYFHRRTGTNVQTGSGAWERVAGEGDAAGLLAFGRYFYLPAGRWTLRVRGRMEGVRAEAPLVLELATRSGRDLLARREVSGTGGAIEERFALELGEITEVEPRVVYGGSGQVWLSELQFHRETR